MAQVQANVQTNLEILQNSRRLWVVDGLLTALVEPTVLLSYGLHEKLAGFLVTKLIEEIVDGYDCLTDGVRCCYLHWFCYFVASCLVQILLHAYQDGTFVLLDF